MWLGAFMMGNHAPSGSSVLRRGLVILAAVLIAAASGGLATACGSDSAKEEFNTYLNAMTKVSEKFGADSAKAKKKAGRTEGALNAYAVWWDAMGDAYKREAAGAAAVVPPENLAKAHKAYVDVLLKSARTMYKETERIYAEIADPDLTEFTDKWVDQTGKAGNRALKRASSAADRYYAAVKAEGTELGIEFTGE